MKLYTADAIKEQVHKLLCRDCEETDVCLVCDYRELIEQILDAPTVDAVEVVRCKDCRFGNRYDEDLIECPLDLNNPPEYNPYDWYCPNGTRREDAD